MSSHRGPHPKDDELFALSEVSILRAAVRDLSWLKTRGYGDNASLKLVGDRYRLRRRQRNAVARSSCSDSTKADREHRRRSLHELEERWLEIDGFNVVITLEGGFGGAYSFIGRDGAYRDVDPVHGTYRVVEETPRAVQAVGKTLESTPVDGVVWRLDDHVSNVGRLKDTLEAYTPASLFWEVSVEENVDRVLVESGRPVATSDSEVLDEVETWCPLEREVFARIPIEPQVRDLRPRENDREHDRAAGDW